MCTAIACCAAGETPDPQVFYGDSTGAVVQLKCGPPPQHTDRPLGPRDYQLLHQEHTDWVTQVGAAQHPCILQ